MALVPVGSGSIRQRLAEAERAKNALKNLRRKGDEMANTLVRTAEVGMASLVAGGIHGRFGDIAPAGVPLALGVGIVMHGAAFAGIGGKNASHLHGLGDGFLASYLTVVGTGIGAQMRKKSLEGPKSKTSGMAGDIPSANPDRGGGVLSDAEMADIAKNA